jgi:hypothetical protein
MTLRALDVPRPARLTCDAGGVPQAVTIGGRTREVVAIRDDWLVQDLWWTGRPVDRRYFELVVEPGRVVTAYREGEGGPWFIHSGGP